MYPDSHGFSPPLLFLPWSLLLSLTTCTVDVISSIVFLLPYYFPSSYSQHSSRKITLKCNGHIAPLLNTPHFHGAKLAVIFLQDSHMLTFLTSFRLFLKSHILLRASLTVLFNSENYSFLSAPFSPFPALFLFIILISIEQIFYSNSLCLLPTSIR